MLEKKDYLQMSHDHNKVAARLESRLPSLHQSQLKLIAPHANGSRVSYFSGMVDVVSIQLNAGLGILGELKQCLSNDERLRASHYVFECDRRRFIVGRAFLRYLLASQLGVEPEAVEFEYGPRGKPALSQRYSDTDLRFNVSHSEDVAVYAFSCGRELGIDVEFVRSISDADDIAVHCFSPREIESYRALDPHDKPLGFFNCWTRKEAFIKAIGDGLHYPLDRFDVSLIPGEPARIICVDGVSGDECGWRMESFSPAPGFVAALVTETATGLSRFDRAP